LNFEGEEGAMPRIAPIPWEELTQQQRDRYQAGVEAGAFTDPVPYQILAYTAHSAAPDDGDRHPNFPNHLLGGRLLELIRIRSAQLGGCEPCSVARKTESATEEVVACLVDTSLRQGLNARERLALELLERLSDDHHSIGDDFYRRLAQHFTTAEIVELGQVCGSTMGLHRFLHTLNFYGQEPPAVPYDRTQVGVTWAQRGREREASLP
jgi:alkylhydroperoxidase family enzyme